MPKDEGLQKHTLNLRAGDMERIRDAYPDIPASTIVRQVISTFVDKLDAAGKSPEVSINL